jgi:fructokinase
VAGFLHALLQHGEQRLAAPAIVRAIVAHACAAGALTTTRPGAIGAQPTAAEVNALLQTPAASLA